MSNDSRLNNLSASPEQVIIKRIEEVARELKEARRDLKEFRRKAMDAETRTINFKIEYERLLEALRRINAAKVVEGESYSLFDDDDNIG